MKIKRMIPVCILFASFGMAAVTHAYLTDWQQAENRISVSDNQIRIEETFDPPDVVVPGTVITKAPCIVNESAVAVYVRMAARFSDSSAEDFCEPLSVKEGWYRHTDGYYYYAEAVPAGGRTETLFDQITIRSTVLQEELIPFDLLIYAESVQTYGKSMEEAWAFYERSGL